MAYETKIALGAIGSYILGIYATAMYFGYDRSKGKSFWYDGWEIAVFSMLWPFTLSFLVIMKISDALIEWHHSHSHTTQLALRTLYILTLPFRPTKVGELVGNWINNTKERR